MLIHPTRDGNGQTFKAIILSYLHDLLPDHQERFVPIKYDQTFDPEKEMAIAFMGGGRSVSEEEDLISGNVPAIETDDSRMNQLIDYALEARRLYYSDNSQEKIDELVSSLVSDCENKLELKNLPQKRIINWENKKGWFRTKRIPIYTPPYVAFMDGCFEYLKKHGYPAESISVSLNYGSNQKLDRASSAVRRLFATQQGQKVLSDYVMTGNAEIGEEDTLVNELFRKTIKMLGRQKENIVKTLETKDEHDRRHQEMMQLLS